MSETKESNIELRLGLFIAIFAAALAISDLFAGKFGDDEIISHNEQTKSYNWYMSKSIKQGMEEGHLNILRSMVAGGMVEEGHEAAVDSLMDIARAEIKRYGKEKKEILVGSSKLDTTEWAQDINGKMGLIVGANEWAEKAEKLGASGDKFDLASLFLQLCLVMGAVGLVISSDQLKHLFFWVMTVFGVIGVYFTATAYLIASAV
ncbi:MAG: DUF4337 family protein [Chitinophagales bacterium]|jgi:hypothetical protein